MMIGNKNNISLLCAFAVSIGCSAPAWGAEASVTPYRPTVSNPASLPAPGWIELEMGAMTRDGKDGTRQNTLPYLAKFAFTPDFGVLLGGDAFVSQTGDAARVSGTGDTTLLLKHRMPLDEQTAAAIGWEYGVKAPTAAHGVGSGSSDVVLNGIFSRGLAGHALDTNLNVTRLGGVPAGESPYQYGFSATVFRPLDDRLGVMAELSGSMRRGTSPQNQWLIAASYMMGPRLVFDAGLSGGGSSASHRVALFAGASMLLGRLR
jgi:hypothetical protein